MTTLILNADMSPVGLLPLSILRWQKVIEKLCTGSLVSVHDYDNWVIHGQRMAIPVPAVAMRTRYTKPNYRMRFSKTAICIRDSYTCQYCKEIFPENMLTLDHVTPVYYGGDKSWENIVAACGFCNNKRGHNIKVQPIRLPYRPDYHEMIGLRKQYPIIIPHESWADYLMWPEDKVILRKSPL